MGLVDLNLAYKRRYELSAALSARRLLFQASAVANATAAAAEAVVAFLGLLMPRVAVAVVNL